MIKCVNVALSSVITRRSSSGLIGVASSRWIGRGNRNGAAFMLRQRPLQQSVVRPHNVLGDVRNRVVGDDVEPDVRIAQGEIGIDDRDAVRRILREHTGEVHRQRVQPTPPPHLRSCNLAGADLGFAFAESVNQLDPVQGGQKVLEPQGIVEELLGPVAQCLQDDAAFGRGSRPPGRCASAAPG